MLSVEDATRRILAAFAPLPPETVGLTEAVGRVLAADVAARLTQPWADVSAMDGFAVRAEDVAAVPATLRRIGTVAAGAAFDGRVGPGSCVRIFTGAPVPAGADSILIQEDADIDGDRVTAHAPVTRGQFVRPAGMDFRWGEVLLRAGRLLTPRDIGLLAAMNVPWIAVHRRPRVAILATGDEVVLPGDPMGPNQIVSSNGPALAALVKVCGGEPISLGIARDDADSLRQMVAGARGADLLITTGGASVGDHDLVRSVLGDAGLAVDFWKIAMRPGKPLIFGRLGTTPLLGLPGNPVSSMVCATLFARPILRALQGLNPLEPLERTARLGRDLPDNDRRQDYLRATLSHDPADGALVATPFGRQDSAMMSRLARADALIVRPPHAPALAAGATVPILPFAAGALSL